MWLLSLLDYLATFWHKSRPQITVWKLDAYCLRGANWITGYISLVFVLLKAIISWRSNQLGRFGLQPRHNGFQSIKLQFSKPRFCGQEFLNQVKSMFLKGKNHGTLWPPFKSILLWRSKQAGRGLTRNCKTETSQRRILFKAY